jgi:hypothetical protein
MLARGGSTRKRANDKNVGFTRVNARNINPPLVIIQSRAACHQWRRMALQTVPTPIPFGECSGS